uniref:Uncharacterized protein n=1 Tax=viral metagenome TaxID=1070528 RepID=A0A6M3K4N9_9ZZZZ
MSWDKNTISLSGLDAVIGTLLDLGIDHEVSIIAEFHGRGLNDDYLDLSPHKLRRLEYGKWVILEKVEQDADCDTDDCILSCKFELDKEPKDWQPIVSTDKTGEYEKLSN